MEPIFHSSPGPCECRMGALRRVLEQLLEGMLTSGKPFLHVYIENQLQLALGALEEKTEGYADAE